MRTRSSKLHTLLLILFLSLAGAQASQADTIRLKNGRVLKGEVVRYGSGEFILLLDAQRRGGRRDRMIVLVETVESIEFGSGSGNAPVATAPEEKVVVVDGSQEVVATGIQLHTGEKVHITASGEIQFADGRVSGPAGLDTTESWPFPGERSGVLIALVGSPNSPVYHVVGDSYEFVPREDGELYLQINARSLTGARGAYTARLRTSLPAVQAATPSPPEPARPTGPRQLRFEIDVPADRDWSDTKIDLLNGDTLRIRAEGTIHYTSSKTCGPDGGKRTWRDMIRALPVNEQGRGALIGLVGESGTATPFFVGAEGEFQVSTSGRLFLGINDDNHGNNRGSFRVHVEIVPARR
ncbi:MAG: hypothetical protein ACE5IP_01180 [Terriglobia bacterium]